MPTSRLGERADLYVRWTRGRWPLEQIFPLRGLKKAGLTHDKFMFAQRPRPLTPALSPKGRGSNAGQFAAARFEVTHFGFLSPGGGVGVRGLSKITPISPDASEIHIEAAQLAEAMRLKRLSPSMYQPLVLQPLRRHIPTIASRAPLPGMGACDTIIKGTARLQQQHLVVCEQCDAVHRWRPLSS